MPRHRQAFTALVAALSIVLAACGSTTPTPVPTVQPTEPPAPSASPAAPTAAPPPLLRLAMAVPLQGPELAWSTEAINGARLALKDAGGVAGGYAIELPDSLILDDALDGRHDPLTGANNMTRIVADESIVGVIGPMNSSVAQAQIPVSNTAGLAQCSPTATNPDLTQGAPAAALRTWPNNFVRVITADDIQGPAGAQYVYETLGKHHVYVIDDQTRYGKVVADAFEDDFKARGGTVTRHDSLPATTDDYQSVLLVAKKGKPSAIYFGGTTGGGGARILLAATEVGLGGIPFVGPDAINDGPGSTPDSFLNLAGEAAQNAHSTLPGISQIPDWERFNLKYRNEYDVDATVTAAQGYACAQVLLDAIARAADTSPRDPAAFREAVRAAMTDPDHVYKTSLGEITFDANGDTSQRVATFWGYDVRAENWGFEAELWYEPN